MSLKRTLQGIGGVKSPLETVVGPVLRTKGPVPNDISPEDHMGSVGGRNYSPVLATGDTTEVLGATPEQAVEALAGLGSFALRQE